MSDHSNQHDVLIVGLGPVGAVLAGLLATYGLSVVVVDREADIYPLPRAAGFDDEAMRIFQALGFADTLLPMCRVMNQYELLSAARELLLRFEMDNDIGQNGWHVAYAFHQPHLERALRRHVEQLGVQVRLSTSFSNFSQGPDGVIAHVLGKDGPETIAAKYLIGCDGANSPVRKLIGSTEFDYGFSETWLVVDAIVPDPQGLSQFASQICDPAQPITLMRTTGNRYRWEFMLTPASNADTFASDESVARLMAPWTEKIHLDIERRALYRFRGVVADRWRDGRVLIAGDAAHLMPPFLGQGMCSGLRDAANLAWKLASVLKDDANDALLDTYQTERQPHVTTVIERAIEIGQMICILDPVLAAERDASMHAMREAGMAPPVVAMPALQEGCLMRGAASGELFIQPVIDGVRLDDVLGPGACLITLNPATRALGSLKQFHLEAKQQEPFVPPLVEWLKQHDAEAVLVRPDRYAFGIGKADELLSAWQAKLGVEAAQ